MLGSQPERTSEMHTLLLSQPPLFLRQEPTQEKTPVSLSIAHWLVPSRHFSLMSEGHDTVCVCVCVCGANKIERHYTPLEIHK